MSQSTPSQSTPVQIYNGRPVFSCAKCATTIALQDELISKAFSGREGRAFLLHSAVNIKLGKKEDRTLLTGVHTVADILCVGCGSLIGWTYLKAHEPSQRYKEGKYIVEKERVTRDNAWELDN